MKNITTKFIVLPWPDPEEVYIERGHLYAFKHKNQPNESKFISNIHPLHRIVRIQKNVVEVTDEWWSNIDREEIKKIIESERALIKAQKLEKEEFVKYETNIPTEYVLIDKNETFSLQNGKIIRKFKDGTTTTTPIQPWIDRVVIRIAPEDDNRTLTVPAGNPERSHSLKSKRKPGPWYRIYEQIKYRFLR